MAVADADLFFTFIDVGAYGREGDSNVFKRTKLGKDLYSGNLNLPEDKLLIGGDDTLAFPYVFLGDEAFAGHRNLLRPYPQRGLTKERRMFNRRLSRARRVIECSFGLLANKWRIFHRAIDVDFVDEIIKACCVLHNFVRRRDGYNTEDTLTCPLRNVRSSGTKADRTAVFTRDAFSVYFNSAQGYLPWLADLV